MTIGTNSTLGINDFKYRIIKYVSKIVQPEVGIPAAQSAT
jgi:hypothetical protein